MDISNHFLEVYICVISFSQYKFKYRYFVKQHTNGGPIIAVQIENEFGSYSDEIAHLIFIKEVILIYILETVRFPCNVSFSRNVWTILRTMNSYWNLFHINFYIYSSYNWNMEIFFSVVTEVWRKRTFIDIRKYFWFRARTILWTWVLKKTYML